MKALVGEGLFEFGDTDGVGNAARLQHALGVAFHDGLIYVADTYNSKIKTIDPVTRSCKTFLGARPGSHNQDRWEAVVVPTGTRAYLVSVIGGKLGPECGWANCDA